MHWNGTDNGDDISKDKRSGGAANFYLDKGEFDSLSNFKVKPGDIVMWYSEA